MVSYDIHGEVFPTGQKEVMGHLAQIWTFYEHSGEAKCKRMNVSECLNPSVKLFSEGTTPAHKFLGRERVKEEERSSRPLGQEARGSDPPICIGSHCVVDVRPPGQKGAGTEQILQLLWSQAPILVLQTHTASCAGHLHYTHLHPQSVWMTQHP